MSERLDDGRVRITDEAHARLKRLARTTGLSYREVIRRALQSYEAAHPPASPPPPEAP